MNVQQKIEKWCRNERFVHYANERMCAQIGRLINTSVARS